MKTVSFLKIVLVVFLSIVFSDCTSDDTTPSNEVIMSQIETAVKTGSWRITNYNDSGKDETADYAGYEFAFNENGSLVATKDAITVNGNWSITNESSDDDDDLDFNIAFSAPELFTELTDDWDVKSNSTTKIELMDVSGGNNTTDLLTFERN